MNAYPATSSLDYHFEMTNIFNITIGNKCHVSIDQTNHDKYDNLFKKSVMSSNEIQPQSSKDALKLFRDTLSLLCQIEGAHMDINNIDSVAEYLRTVGTPKIVDLYNVLFPNESMCFRDSSEQFVGVSKRSTKRFEEFYKIGIKGEDIDAHSLQGLVNYYYGYKDDDKFMKDIIGFVCYLLYERIHLHKDGNRRIGGLLFIENIYAHAYFPLSLMLTTLNMPEIMEDIFSQVNFPVKVYKLDDGYGDSEEYYELRISDELLRKITNCLCMCREMQYFVQLFCKLDKACGKAVQLLRKKLIVEKIKGIVGGNGYILINSSDFDVDNHNEVIAL